MHSYSSLLGAALLLCVLIPFAQNNNTISCNLRLLLRQNLVFQFMRKEKEYFWAFCYMETGSLYIKHP